MPDSIFSYLFSKPPGTALAALVAGGFALLLTLVLGRYTIAWLVRRSINDGTPRKASDTLNDINADKARVPTMGGIFVLTAISVCALLFLPLDSPGGWVVMAAMLGCGALGAYDDWIKLTRRTDAEGRTRDGVSGRFKLAAQTLLFTGCAVALWAGMPEESRVLWMPLMDDPLYLGWTMIPLAVFVCVGTCNAVNLSDGLDGLAGGLTVMTTLVLAVAALLAGNVSLPGLPATPFAPETAIIALIVAGACLGFLRYNRHPARVFMGDTGSLALGAGIGTMAVALRVEILLVLAGAVFLAEAGSVIIQVGYFKLSGGKRVFLCSPLHHHFQFKGWKETKVTRRFWLVNGLFCAAGLLLLALPLMMSPSDGAMTGPDSPTVEQPGVRGPNNPLPSRERVDAEDRSGEGRQRRQANGPNQRTGS